MKKKLLVLLLIITVAAFVFTGCTPPTPSEGEGEGEVEGVVVEIDGAINIGGQDYVAPGAHAITVKFSAPVATALVSKTNCTGDYSKGLNDNYDQTPVVLWPNADKTEWTGSVYFDCDPCGVGSCVETSDCCAAYIIVEAGDCDYCDYYFPFIVDCHEPEVDLQFRFVDCGDACDPCAVTNAAYLEWRTYDGGNICEPESCCEDDCSGVAGWVMTIDDDVCAGPCDEISGTGCPVEGVSDCCFIYPKDTGEASYPVEFRIKDNVGNEAKGNWVVEVTTLVKASTDKDNTPEVKITIGSVSKNIKGVGNATGWFDIPVSGGCINTNSVGH